MQFAIGDGYFKCVRFRKPEKPRPCAILERHIPRVVCHLGDEATRREISEQRGDRLWRSVVIALLQFECVYESTAMIKVSADGSCVVSARHDACLAIAVGLHVSQSTAPPHSRTTTAMRASNETRSPQPSQSTGSVDRVRLSCLSILSDFSEQSSQNIALSTTCRTRVC